MISKVRAIEKEESKRIYPYLGKYPTNRVEDFAVVLMVGPKEGFVGYHSRWRSI